jgi:threonine synthase
LGPPSAIRTRPAPAVVLRGRFCDCQGAVPGPVLVCPRRGDPDVECVPHMPDRLGLPLVTDPASQHPFLRYRDHIAASREDPEAYETAVAALDDAVADLTGRRLAVTPTVDGAGVMAALGRPGVDLLVKDETCLPAASHKIRHLFGVGLQLRLQSGAAGEASLLRGRRLAISSCGNAAHAAAVVAAALDWPIDVFVPPGADPHVLSELQRLGASVVPCPRLGSQSGDPCQRAFQEAVAGGAIPFGVQGPDNAWALDGGRTIAFELAEASCSGRGLDHLVVQVGGGALAAATWSGLDLATRLGVLPRRPVLAAVQTAGAAPLARAGAVVAARAARHGLGAAMAWAVRHRSEVMWPWETEPRSVATGILDDETYDWAAVVDAVLSSGGTFEVVDDDALVAANRLVLDHLGIAADETGTAGLAGLAAGLDRIADGSAAAVLVTGARRPTVDQDDEPRRGDGPD